MIQKTGPATIKALSEAGSGSAVFATMNIIDKDNDITIPGAFGDQLAKFVGAHDWSAPPIGIAKVREEGNLAIADFQINLSMASGKEWYQSLKFSFDNNVPQELSYGFDVLKYSYRDEGGKQVRVLESMKVYEVSPVMIGAGVNTHLRAMKSGRPMDEHFESVCLDLTDFISRAESLTALRAKEHRDPLSQTMKERITTLSLKLADLTKSLEAMLRGEAPSVNSETILSMQARCFETQMRIAGTLEG